MKRVLKYFARKIPITKRLLETRDAAIQERDAAIRAHDAAFKRQFNDANTPPCGNMLVRRGRPLVVDEPSTFEAPDSQLVSEAQIRSHGFEYWRRAFRMKAGLNRKLWEYLYIANGFNHYIGLKEGVRVLGFGVGRERIPAVLAARGCHITATDYDEGGNWTAKSIADLLQPLETDTDPGLAHEAICDPEIFSRNVSFRNVDMNNIPADLRGYDCLWSCGSLEHIGGLDRGLDFIERSLDCLRPGGIAIHTTEFNLSSNEHTLDTPTLSFYRRQDIEALASRLQASGHHIVLNFTRGTSCVDNHVDKAPYDYSLTMNALHWNFIITSIGLIIQKN